MFLLLKCTCTFLYMQLPAGEIKLQNIDRKCYNEYNSKLFKEKKTFWHLHVVLFQKQLLVDNKNMDFSKESIENTWSNKQMNNKLFIPYMWKHPIWLLWASF